MWFVPTAVGPFRFTSQKSSVNQRRKDNQRSHIGFREIPELQVVVRVPLLLICGNVHLDQFRLLSSAETHPGWDILQLSPLPHEAELHRVVGSSQFGVPDPEGRPNIGWSRQHGQTDNTVAPLYLSASPHTPFSAVSPWRLCSGHLSSFFIPSLRSVLDFKLWSSNEFGALLVILDSVAFGFSQHLLFFIANL